MQSSNSSIASTCMQEIAPQDIARSALAFEDVHFFIRLCPAETQPIEARLNAQTEGNLHRRFLNKPLASQANRQSGIWRRLPAIIIYAILLKVNRYSVNFLNKNPAPVLPTQRRDGVLINFARSISTPILPYIFHGGKGYFYGPKR